MRILLTLSMVLLTATLYAKGLSLGLNIGSAYTQPPKTMKDWRSEGSQNILAGLQLTFDKRNFQCGAGMDYTELDFTFALGQRRHVTPFLHPFLLGNYKFNFGKSFLYAGINIGMVVPVSDKLSGTFTELEHESKAEPFAVGGQIGFNYRFTKHISLNFETGVRHSNIYTTSYAKNEARLLIYVPLETSFYYFPTTLGVRYSL